MYPLDLNAGRFYLRQLRHDDRVDDGPALREMFGTDNFGEEFGQRYFDQVEKDWEDDQAYRWAVSEQTLIDLVALAVVKRDAQGQPQVEIIPRGDESRVLPGDDKVLVKMTVSDAMDAARTAATKWAQQALA